MIADLRSEIQLPFHMRALESLHTYYSFTRSHDTCTLLVQQGYILHLEIPKHLIFVYNFLSSFFAQDISYVYTILCTYTRNMSLNPGLPVNFRCTTYGGLI